MFGRRLFVTSCDVHVHATKQQILDEQKILIHKMDVCDSGKLVVILVLDALTHVCLT